MQFCSPTKILTWRTNKTAGQVHSGFTAAAHAKFLDDIADAQRDEWAAHNGSIPEVVPNYHHGPIPPDPAFGAGFAVLWWNQFVLLGGTAWASTLVVATH